MYTRVKDRLDYKVLHRTGRKVLKVVREIPDNRKMDEDFKIEELKLEEDINHAFHIYTLGDLVTQSEIEEGIDIVSDLCQKFRHLHVEIKTKPQI